MGWNIFDCSHSHDNGAMNADKYIRNILEEHVVPFAPYIGENFIFMDDNAKPHRARFVQEYLEVVEARVEVSNGMANKKSRSHSD